MVVETVTPVSRGTAWRGATKELEIKADESCSGSLRRVEGKTDFPARYHGTPIADWLRYHNLGEGPHIYDSPQLLIVTCMDYRVHFQVSKNFAYVLRLARANLCHREFDLACALVFAGGALGAYLGGMPRSEALAVGFGLNARGAMEIILAFLALEYSLINEKVFVALVITAIVTSMMSGPLIQWAMRAKLALRQGMIPVNQ